MDPSVWLTNFIIIITILRSILTLCCQASGYQQPLVFEVWGQCTVCKCFIASVQIACDAAIAGESYRFGSTTTVLIWLRLAIAVNLRCCTRKVRLYPLTVFYNMPSRRSTVRNHNNPPRWTNTTMKTETKQKKAYVNSVEGVSLPKDCPNHICTEAIPLPQHALKI